MNIIQAKWDAIYTQEAHQPKAAEVLADYLHLLPKQGNALDLACGLGGNALLLAETGLSVDAWDISPVALQKLQVHACSQKLQIEIRQCNLAPEILPDEHYDVIVISRFLDRMLCNAIMTAMKPGGLLFYQTFTRSKLDQSGPANPDYLLASNELLRLFSPLTVVCYQEYARIGDLNYGNRNEAYFIGQKPLAGI